jgi:hypothetical protein
MGNFTLRQLKIRASLVFSVSVLRNKIFFIFVEHNNIGIQFTLVNSQEIN